jgi:hypothetical protein
VRAACPRPQVFCTDRFELRLRHARPLLNVKHEPCLVSPEELIHLGPALGLIAFLRCVEVLLRRVWTLAAI